MLLFLDFNIEHWTWISLRSFELQSRSTTAWKANSMGFKARYGYVRFFSHLGGTSAHIVPIRLNFLNKNWLCGTTVPSFLELHQLSLYRWKALTILYKYVFGSILPPPTVFVSNGHMCWNLQKWHLRLFLTLLTFEHPPQQFLKKCF